MNGKKTALFLGFFSLFSLSLAATRIKNKPYKSLINVKTLPGLYFWEKVGGVKHLTKKKTDRPKVTSDIAKKEIEKKAMDRSNQIVLCSRKAPNTGRRSERLAALQTLLKCPVCHKHRWSSSEQLNIHANSHFDEKESS